MSRYLLIDPSVHFCCDQIDEKILGCLTSLKHGYSLAEIEPHRPYPFYEEMRYPVSWYVPLIIVWQVQYTKMQECFGRRYMGIFVY